MTNKINDYLAAYKITMSAEFVPQSQSHNPGKEAKLNWRITLFFDGRALPVFDYSQGITHCVSYVANNLLIVLDACKDECETGIGNKWRNETGYSCRSEKTPSPELADMLYCVLANTPVLDAGGFVNWCDEYGCDSDSIKAKAIYDQCIEQALNLRGIVGDRMIDELRTLFPDY